MSQAALLIATRDFIRDNFKYEQLKLSQMECEIMPDGRPMPGSGQFFIAIHDNGFKGNSDEILDCYHSINITVTMKVADVPIDKMGIARIVKRKLGMDEVAHWLAWNIHNNYYIIKEANEIIYGFPITPEANTGKQNIFIEPLRFGTASRMQLKDGTWFHGAGNTGEVGLIQDLVFVKARRIQYGNWQPTALINKKGQLDLTDSLTVEEYNNADFSM